MFQMIVPLQHMQITAYFRDCDGGGHKHIPWLPHKSGEYYRREGGHGGILIIYLLTYMRVFGFQFVKVGSPTEGLTKKYDTSAES